MTTVNTVGIHHCVIVTTEMHRYTVNIDNAVHHGSAKNRVHFGVMYTTGYKYKHSSETGFSKTVVRRILPKPRKAYSYTNTFIFVALTLIPLLIWYGG